MQYHLKLSFLQGIYGLWQKEKFHKKKKKKKKKKNWRRSYLALSL